MAWSSQSAGASWPAQQATAAYEPERVNTPTHLLTQLGLVPSQATPAHGTHNGSMPAQTLLSTTVAPPRSHPQHAGEHRCIDSTPVAQSPFLSTPPSHSQRYQAFTPGSDLQVGDEFMSTTPGSTMKHFQFNPHAMPFVFSSAPGLQKSNGADRYSDRAETESTSGNFSRAGLSSDEGEDREGATVSAAVASAAIFSPQQGPAPTPPAVKKADAVRSSDPSRASTLLSTNSWRGERAVVADTYAWLPASAMPLPQSSQDVADDYSKPSHNIYADIAADASPTLRGEEMCPELMQLRGTAHSVALGALDLLSPDLGPTFSPRAPVPPGVSV